MFIESDIERFSSVGAYLFSALPKKDGALGGASIPAKVRSPGFSRRSADVRKGSAQRIARSPFATHSVHHRSHRLKPGLRTLVTRTSRPLFRARKTRTGVVPFRCHRLNRYLGAA